MDLLIRAIHKIEWKWLKILNRSSTREETGLHQARFECKKCLEECSSFAFLLEGCSFFLIFFILSFFLKGVVCPFLYFKRLCWFLYHLFSKEWSSCRRGFVVLLDNPSSCRIRFQRKIIISQEIELLKESECWSSAHQGNRATLFHSPRAWSRSKCSSCCGLCSCRGPWSRSTRPALMIF